MFPVWTRGSIATEPNLPVDGLPLMLIDARTRHGQSGSPVILHSGRTETTVFTNGSLIADGQEHAEWLGVYSGRTDNESDLGRVWHADATRDIARHGTRPHTPWERHHNADRLFPLTGGCDHVAGDHEERHGPPTSA